MSHWDIYTVSSVISGVALVIMAVLPGLKPGTRLLYAILGVGFAYYGYWIARQTTGTYYFPVYVFIIPFVALFNVIRVVAERGRSSGPSHAPSGSGPRASPPRATDPSSTVAPAPPESPLAGPGTLRGITSSATASPSTPPPAPPSPSSAGSASPSAGSSKLKGKLAPP
jgi:hypothetical protein